MQIEYINSFEKMLEVALAEDSVSKARPMSDVEIVWLEASLRKKVKKSSKAIDKDLEHTLLSMIGLIQSDSGEEDKIYARKLLRRINEVAINLAEKEARILH